MHIVYFYKRLYSLYGSCGPEIKLYYIIIIIINDIFKLQQLKFYCKLFKGDLPKYFQHFSCIHNFEIRHHYTRETSSIFIPRFNHAYAQKHIRHNLIQTINNTPNNIIDKIHTHSLRGFLNYIKVFIFGNYEDHCHVSNCYIYANLEIYAKNNIR